MRYPSDFGHGLYRQLLLITVFLAGSALPGPVQGQSLDSLKQQYRIAVPPAVEPVKRVVRVAPGISANSPVAFGADWGDVFMGAGFQGQNRYERGVDGIVAAGIGFGNARRLVGLQVDVISFTTFDSGFGKRMGMDFTLHRMLSQDLAVAVGYESAFIRRVPIVDPAATPW